MGKEVSLLISISLFIFLALLSFVSAQVPSVILGTNSSSSGTNVILDSTPDGGVTFNNNTGSVNSSDYWDTMDTINTTQMQDNGGILNILESWLDSLFFRIVDFQSAFDANVTGAGIVAGNHTSDVFNIYNSTWDNAGSHVPYTGAAKDVNLGSHDFILGTINISGVNNMVGIGTDSPSNELNVIGDANITTDFYVGDDAFINDDLLVYDDSVLYGKVELGDQLIFSNNKWMYFKNSTGDIDGTGWYRTTSNGFFLRFHDNSFIYHSADDKDIRYWGSDNLANYNYKFINGINDWNTQHKDIDFRYRGTNESNPNLFYIDANDESVSIGGELFVSGPLHYPGGVLGESLHLFGESEEELSVARYYTNEINHSEYGFSTTGKYTGAIDKNYIINITKIDNSSINNEVGCMETNDQTYCTYFKWSDNNGTTWSNEEETKPGFYTMSNGTRFSMLCTIGQECDLKVGDTFRFTALSSPIYNLKIDTLNDEIISQTSVFNITKDLYVGEGLKIDNDVLVVDDVTNRVGVNEETPQYSLDITGDVEIDTTLIQIDEGGNVNIW